MRTQNITRWKKKQNEIWLISKSVNQWNIKWYENDIIIIFECDKLWCEMYKNAVTKDELIRYEIVQ